VVNHETQERKLSEGVGGQKWHNDFCCWSQVNWFIKFNTFNFHWSSPALSPLDSPYVLVEIGVSCVASMLCWSWLGNFKKGAAHSNKITWRDVVFAWDNSSDL
jgi:hypothetical protein